GGANEESSGPQDEAKKNSSPFNGWAGADVTPYFSPGASRPLPSWERVGERGAHAIRNFLRLHLCALFHARPDEGTQFQCNANAPSPTRGEGVKGGRSCSYSFPPALIPLRYDIRITSNLSLLHARARDAP